MKKIRLMRNQTAGGTRNASSVCLSIHTSSFGKCECILLVKSKSFFFFIWYFDSNLMNNKAILTHSTLSHMNNEIRIDTSFNNSLTWQNSSSDVPFIFRRFKYIYSAQPNEHYKFYIDSTQHWSNQKHP